MWGNFMEKAKVVAANIDQQLNESVGLESSSEQALPLQSQGSHENAWNDDCNFDDDDIDLSSTTQASQLKPSIAEETPAEEIPSASAATPAPEEPKQPEPVLPDVQEEPPEKALLSHNQPLENMASTEPPVAPEPESLPHKQPLEDTTPPEPPTQVVEPRIALEPESPVQEMLENGLGTKEEEEVTMNDDQDVGEKYSQKETVQEADVHQEEEMKEEEAPGEMIQSPQKDDTTSSSTPSEAPADPIQNRSLSAASSVFSNLTSQVSTPLASLTANLSSQNNEQEEQSSKKVASLFLSLASAVDSALDKAVDDAPKDDTVPPIDDSMDDSGWNDEDVFKVPDDTEVAGESESKAPTLEAPQTETDTVEFQSIIHDVQQQSENNETVDSPKEDDVFVNNNTLQTLEVSKPTATNEGVTTRRPSSMGTTSVFISINEDDPRYKKLQQDLKLREDQLADKSEQLAQLQSLWENQEMQLNQKIQDTKEEAKKRIMRAKERCQAVEARLKQSSTKGADTSAEKDQIIAELREEGESLARKQSTMEQAVRAAHGETKKLKSNLAEEIAAKDEALEKITKLEADLKVTKGSLKSAQKGESQAGKLEEDLLTAKSAVEMKGATILSLQQQIKELLSEGKELTEELEKTRKSAAQEAQQERKSMRRELSDVISDLETKLRITEREAGVREDALRHEVKEVRKRWQDAVRRADALSMDVQSSTSPLLRQLESMERQNRARTAGWAELENRLRSELEETVIQNETLSRERSEFKTKYTRLERSANDSELQLKECRRTIEDETSKVSKLETRIELLVAESETRQEEYLKVERLANEGVMRVRSEMTQTVVDSEERYRGQIDKLEGEVRVEKEKRSQLEKQVKEILDNTGMIVPTPNMTFSLRESKPQKLRKAEGQAEILAGALGLDDSEDESDDEIFGESMERGIDGSGNHQKGSGMGSFAALEQLTSRLKAAQVELEALRKNLRESEKSRDLLLEELAESRTAKEKLPLFEAKVRELTEENQEMELEIQGLQYDVAEVRELYRMQLNILLEEKASKISMENGLEPSPQNEAKA